MSRVYFGIEVGFSLDGGHFDIGRRSSVGGDAVTGVTR